MTVKLHDLEFLSLKGGCTSSAESTPVKMPHCWRSHVTAHLLIVTKKKTTTCNIVFNSIEREREREREIQLGNDSGSLSAR